MAPPLALQCNSCPQRHISVVPTGHALGAVPAAVRQLTMVFDRQQQTLLLWACR